MEQYIVLDFTTAQPVRRHPGITLTPPSQPRLTSSIEYQGHLLPHYVFQRLPKCTSH